MKTSIYLPNGPEFFYLFEEDKHHEASLYVTGLRTIRMNNQSPNGLTDTESRRGLSEERRVGGLGEGRGRRSADWK